jgi:hypothetical protein
MRKKDTITLYFDKGEGRKGGHRRYILIFMAILVFIAFFMPIFGDTLRYQASHLFQEIFNTVGSFAKIAGIVLIGFGFLSIFLGRRIKVSALLFGALLLWIGCFLTYTPFTLFGFNFGGSQPPIGYH